MVSVAKKQITSEKIKHNKPVKLQNGCFYIIHPKHRDKTEPDASQWTITKEEETDCFKETLKKCWIVPNDAKNLCIEGEFGWGLKITLQKTLEFLGHTGKNRGQKKVKFAKFRNDKQSKQGNWHGYPADYLRNTQDIPEDFILKIWKNEGYISKTIMSKIMKGKPCKQIQE